MLRYTIFRHFYPVKKLDFCSAALRDAPGALEVRPWTTELTECALGFLNLTSYPSGEAPLLLWFFYFVLIFYCPILEVLGCRVSHVWMPSGCERQAPEVKKRRSLHLISMVSGLKSPGGIEWAEGSKIRFSA